MRTITFVVEVVVDDKFTDKTAEEILDEMEDLTGRRDYELYQSYWDEDEE